MTIPFLERWLHTVQNYDKPGVRIVSYLSVEFLLGPHLENNLVNLGIYDEARRAMEDLGLKYFQQYEPYPASGNPREMAPTLVRKPFAQVIRNTGKSLEQAYKHFHRRRKGRERFEMFCSENSSWMEDFSIFVVLKKTL